MRVAEAEMGKRISCVMSDAFMWFSGDVAAEMGVPWVPVYTSAACSLSVHFYTDLIRETVGIHGKKSVGSIRSSGTIYDHICL
ncbi:Anthocyanidin 3-O-galactosyltransferase 3gt1 [Sarracenia purpurea var. burkii]